MRLGPILALGGLSLACAVASCSGDEGAAPGPGSESDGGTDASDGGEIGAEADAPSEHEPDVVVGPERRVVVLFTSDEHSHVLSFSPEVDDFPSSADGGQGQLVGGVARRAAVLDRERALAKAAGKSTVTVSAGDNQMGALPHVAFESASIDYGTLAALGYDVTTLGNHELDFGPKSLAASIATARAKNALPPIVASNIHFSSTDPGDDDLAALYSDAVGDDKPIHPYRVVTTDDGVKVGFFGFVGVNAGQVAPNKTPVQFSAVGVSAANEGVLALVLPKLYADLQPVVDTLRNVEKVDVVVALSHAGIADPAHPSAGEDYAIASHVTGIDLIVSGHAHVSDPKPIVVHNATSDRDVVILNASCYGKHVGRAELVIPGDPTKPVTLEPATQALLPVDETSAPDPARASELGPMIAAIEAAGGTGGASYLEGLLSRVAGAPVVDDATTPGDLYFYPLATTSFDAASTHSLVFLAADAQLAMMDALGDPAEIGLEAGGTIRGVLNRGKTGVVTAADAFSVLPLGRSPVDGTLGYPLVKAYLPVFYLRAVFEFASSWARGNPDFDLSTAGVLAELDCSRPAVAAVTDLLDPTKGRVRKLWLDTNHANGFEQFDKLIYDASDPQQSMTTAYSVVTSSYIASFASTVGASLSDQNGQVIPLADAIVHRTDGSEVKELEAFMAFLQQSPGGALPATYDEASPKATARFAKMALCP